MSGIVKTVKKVVKSVGKAVGGIVKKAAPILAPIAMVAFPGIGTAIGASLGLSGTAATLAGGGLIGAGGAALAGRNPLQGALLGAGGAYLGSTFGGAQGLLGGGGGALGTGLTPGAAGAQGLYGIMPATSGYGLAASSLPATAGSIGALGTGIYPTAAMSLAAPSAGLLGGSNIMRALGAAQGLLGQQQPVQPTVQYQQPTMMTGAPNFDPTIGLLTRYQVI